MTAFHVQLTQWQGAYAAEPPLRITARHPAIIEDAIEATQVGVDLTDAIMRYIDDGLDEYGRHKRFIGSGGRDFPVHDALMYWDRHCRAKHSRWPDHRGRPVCADIVWAVIRDRCSVSWASAMSAVTEERGRRLLDLGFQFMGRMQARWMAQQTERVSHDRQSCMECAAAG